MRLLLIAALLCCLPAQAQEIASQGLVRHYDFKHSGQPLWPVAPTFEIDFSQDPSGATITANTGQVLTKAGAPARILDGTYPDGISAGPTGYAHSFDGAADYYTRTDDDTFDPAGDFSVCAVVTPVDTVSTSRNVFGKYHYSTNMGWYLMQYGTTFSAYITKDGGTGTREFISQPGAAVAGMPVFLCTTYEYKTDGTSVLKLYVDGAAVATKSDATGPVYNSTGEILISTRTSSGSYAEDPSVIHHLAYFDGTALTANEIALAAASYRGTTNNAGSPLTVSSASPPMVQLAGGGLGVEPLFVPMPANTTQIGSPAATRGGLVGTSARTSFIQRGTFETCSAGDFTGWSEFETPGTGTAAITCDTSTMADGATSAAITLAGTDSNATLMSSCFTDGIGADLYVQAMMKGTGSGDLDFIVREYDAANCSTSLQLNYILTGYDTAATWERKGGLVAAGDWHADTSSWLVYFYESGDSGVTTIIDSVEAYAGSEPRPGFCGSDTSASTVCTSSVPYDHSPISADGPLTLRFTASSPWAGIEVKGNYLFSDGPSTTNSLRAAVSDGADEPIFYVYDGSGGLMYVASNVLNWASSTDYALQFERDGLGGAGMYWNGAWNTTTAGAGTGHRSAAQSAFYFGGANGTAGGDVWIRDFYVFRRVMR